MLKLFYHVYTIPYSENLYAIKPTRSSGPVNFILTSHHKKLNFDFDKKLKINLQSSKFTTQRRMVNSLQEIMR